jgi:hypothetical protein
LDTSINSPDNQGIAVALNGDGGKLAFTFKNFVLSDNIEYIYQDWIAKTQELIHLCEPDLSVRKA